jgi:molybdopterin-guanine dinucleotide biosynthesis protein A
MYSRSKPSAIILAGGRSSRMGQPKAAMTLDGMTVLGRIVGELRPYFSSIILVTAPAGQESLPLADLTGDNVRVFHDEAPFAGPVAVLAAALHQCPTEHAFVGACDLPLIKAPVVLHLFAMLAGHDAVIPVVNGRWQMLHAVYHRRCAEKLSEMQERDERKLARLADLIDVRAVEESELQAVDPQLESFFNLNTVADYERARAILRERKEKLASLRA